MLTWERDERPASLYTRLYVLGMRLRRDKQAFEGAQHTLSNARKLQRKGSRPPTRWARLTSRVTTTTVAGMQVWTVAPRRGGAKVRVVYVHGGGYVHPLTADYWRLVRSLARTPAEVVVPDYPLAPDATVDDVLRKLLEVHVAASGADPDVPVVLMGDSAGGALVIAMALRIRDTGGPEPSGVVALSPWLDATLRDREVPELEPTDPMLAESGLRAAGRLWAGVHPPMDPLVSPVEADLDGLPPLDVYIGDRDILRPAVDALADRAREDNISLDVHEVTAMFHVWMTRAIPEARRTRRELADLLAGKAS